jgi:type IV pilus assembly protein PilO
VAKTGDKQKSQNQAVIVAVIMGVLIIVLFWNLAYSPLTERIAKLNTDIAAVQVKLDEANGIAGQQTQVERELATVQRNLTMMSEMLPQKKDIPKMLKLITQRGNENSIKFNNFRPTALIPREFYNEVPIEMSVKANFNNLGQFFTKLGNLNRIVNIENVQISPGTADNARESISASFVIKTFTYAEGGGI